MDKSQIEIKVNSEHGKIKRTITDHTDIHDLMQQIDAFIKETDEAIKAGKRLSVSCCNNWRCWFRRCLRS